MMSRFHSKILVLAAVITGAAMMVAPQASALSGADFNPGNIISGGVFSNNTAMTTAEVQNFLNGKVPSCDTSGAGSKSYNYNSTTGRVGNAADPWISTSRAVYGQRYNAYNATGIAGAPFVCLRDYVENPTTHANNLQNPGASVPGGLSAASIISNAANQYSINPMVLIVTLQKEQSLITDDWPWTNQYKTAMGYGCPDTAACDAQYFGFANQVNNAAKQFRRYLTNPTDYNYVVGTNFIKYNPNAACGGTNVNIQNQSTAALYDYTPYQPNPPALSSLSYTSAGGNGDACSTHGNRNFWWYFTTWFGSTQTNVPYAWTLSSSVAFSDSGRTVPYSAPSPSISIVPSGKAYLTVQARNIGNQTWDKNTVRMGTVRPTDRVSQFADGSWFTTARLVMQETTVMPGEVATFKFALAAPATVGSYTECFNMVAEGITWIPGADACFSIDVVAAQDGNTSNLTLNSGESVLTNKYLMSPNTHSVAVLQPDGNFVLYSDGIAKWNTNTTGSHASKLLMQPDGNLVLYTDAGAAFWSSGTGGNPGARAVLQTDGNLVVYASGGAPLWFTNTSNVPDYSKSVLHGLQNGPLYPKQSLQWADRSHKLLMQDDGNLVLYSGVRPVWWTGTGGHPGAYAVMQPDGNFVVYDTAMHPLWASYTNGNLNSRIMLQNDSNMVIYRPDGGWVWQSRTLGQ